MVSSARVLPPVFTGVPAWVAGGPERGVRATVRCAPRPGRRRAVGGFGQSALMGDGSRREWCRKHRYRSRVDALIALARVRAKDDVKRAKQEQRAYRCPRCHGWHLTSRAQ